MSSFGSRPSRRFPQDFACGLLSALATLTPANRLEFKSARPDQFFAFPILFSGITLARAYCSSTKCDLRHSVSFGHGFQWN